MRFTEGFNPKPKMEFSRPLSLGVASDGEYMAAEISSSEDIGVLKERLNKAVPEGFCVQSLSKMRKFETKDSIMRRYWGADYIISSESESVIAEIRSILPDYMDVLEKKDNRLYIRVEEGSGKGPSPAKFFQKYTEVYTLKRIIQYARSNSGGESYSRYEDVYCYP